MECDTDGMVADDGEMLRLQLSSESLKEVVGSGFGHSV